MCTTNCRPDSDHAVRYDERFFSEGWFQNWDMLQHVLCGLLESDPKWRAILDYGCGPGIMIDLMNSRGRNYAGCDISPEARELYLRRFGKNPDKYHSSMSSLSDQPFDLLISFDVLEHMKDDEIAGLLDQIPLIPEILVNISRISNIPGHINIKSDRAWLLFFESRGWICEKGRTQALRVLYLRLRPSGGDLWHRNMFLLKRAAAPV